MIFLVLPIFFHSFTAFNFIGYFLKTYYRTDKFHKNGVAVSWTENIGFIMPVSVLSLRNIKRMRLTKRFVFTRISRRTFSQNIFIENGGCSKQSQNVLKCLKIRFSTKFIVVTDESFKTHTTLCRRMHESVSGLTRLCASD